MSHEWNSQSLENTVYAVKYPKIRAEFFISWSNFNTILKQHKEVLHCFEASDSLVLMT